MLSCTEMRSVETIQKLEATLRKPVVTSNQAMMFEVLGSLGIHDPVTGFGRLLDENGPERVMQEGERQHA